MSAPIASQVGTDAFFLRRQYLSLGLSAFIAVLISAVAAFVVAHQLLIPIRRLEAGAKTLASGNYAARIKQDRTDELGQLIRHYNALAATLEYTDAAEREWISNTSHELQTPLAVLRAQIEALQDGIRQPDAKTLTEMHAAMMRLSRCLIPRFDGAILSQEWKEALWDKFVMGAPRPRTLSELQYNDRKLRSRR